ncbi:MAG: exopolyphosphatase [Pseudomonadota bacterium]
MAGATKVTATKSTPAASAGAGSSTRRRFTDGALGAGDRFGVVDIGSNSVRLVVFDTRMATPAVFFNEKVLCGLGADLEQTGKLSPVGRARAGAALRRFSALAERMRLSALAAVGTAALREAADGAAFVAEVARETGLEIRIADGPEEARLAAQGVLLGDPKAEGVVADMGGASLELVELADGRVSAGGVTSPLGPLRVMNWGDLSPNKRDAAIDEALAAAMGDRFRKPERLYLLGGSWRAAVSCYMARENYPLPVLHGFALPHNAAVEMAEWVAQMTPEDVSSLAGVSRRRSEVTPLAAGVLARLLVQVKPETVALSAFGLREGVLWEHLPEALKGRDPLLDACAAMERDGARMPGFGVELWRWLEPALTTLVGGEARLAQAACLLADVNWRAHPDYRSRASFEVVTRNNLGLSAHADRLFIGVALLNRYKAGRRAAKGELAVSLLPLDRLRRAEAVGRGIRLGAMLAGAAPGLLPQSPIRRVKAGKTGPAAVVLQLSGEMAALRGEEVEKRLEAFAAALGVDWRVDLV